MDIAHAFVEKRDEDIEAEGQDFPRTVRNYEIGFQSHACLVQIDAVCTSCDGCEPSDPCCTKSKYAAISSPYSLVQLIVAACHGRCVEINLMASA
jgi:hypothetical protein